jgi:thioredoxin-related protein
MKKLIIFLLIISNLFASKIGWYGVYDEALKEAKSQKKILMVLLVKNRCSECNEVIANNFINKPYLDRLNKKVVSVIVNFDSKKSYPIEMYWSNVYPTLFFVDPENETFVYKPIYKITKKEILKILEQF